MHALVEIQWKLTRKAMELSCELGWESICKDSNELFEAKLELRAAALELNECIAKYREAERKYKEALNADNGDN